MSSILSSQRTVYRAPTKGRAYLTLRAAAKAEADSMIVRKYPTEKPEYENGMCYYGGYHWSSEERLLRVHKRLVRHLLRAFRAAAIDQARATGAMKEGTK